MMSKEEIVNELHSWVTEEAFAPNKERLDKLNEGFKKLVEASEEAQLNAFVDEGGEAEAFEYKPEAEDSRYRELLSIYHEKRKQIDKVRTDQEASNLSAKQALVAELHSLIQDEENIGKAYKRFNAIKQKWNETGPVPNAQRRELQGEYSRLIELFYYNINIYKELQINDLKKNQELKMQVIDEIRLLENEKSINQVDFLIHKYLDEWDEIGPTFQEEWEKIRESFKSEVGKVFDRIREHRNEVKQEHHQHFEQKAALVSKVEEIAAVEYAEIKDLQKATREVIDLQKQWKKIGYAGRGKNDKIWASFRAACDQFFSKRDKFMEASGAEFDKARAQKKALIDRAKEIYQGEDVAAIANELKSMQRTWKETGKILPHEEFKLFKEFRKYCDAFFNRKKSADESAQKAAKQIIQAKEEMLKRINKLIDEGIKDKGEAAIAEMREQWMAIGETPFKLKDRLEKSFEQAITRAYKSLGISSSELEEKRFESKIEMLTDSANADAGLKQERSIINQKIRDAQTLLAQEESKLDFFKYSDETNPLKKELLSRIEGVKSDIDALKEKKKKVDLTLKGIKQEETAQAERSAEEGR